METVEHTPSYDWVGESASRLAKASLLIYLFFALFGTALPFQEQTGLPEDGATENLVNQIVYTTLFALSFIGLLPRRSQAIEILKQEKYLGLFLLWSLLSISWSDFPYQSFKRWIQISGMVIVFVSALLYIESEEESLGYVRAILIAYIPLSLLSVLLVPGATQWKFPAWRGLASHKNLLGQISLLSLVIWALAAFQQDLKRKMLALLYCGFSLVLLIGSRSIASAMTCGIMVIIAGIYYTEKTLVRPIVGRFFSPILLFLCIAPPFFFLSIAPDTIDSLFGYFGKDLSLTGRVDIWSTMLDEAREHWIAGCGFDGFWVVNSPAMTWIQQELDWTVPTAHQGYLEILNETGIIGLSLFLFLTISYLKKCMTDETPHPLAWIFITVLILNFSESTLFRLHDASGALFLFSYLALHAEHFREGVSEGMERAGGSLL